MLRSAYEDHPHKDLCSGDRRGWNKKQQMLRRQLASDLLVSEAFSKYQLECQDLLHAHGGFIIAHYDNFAARNMVLPMSSYSRHAVRLIFEQRQLCGGGASFGSGSQPSVLPGIGSGYWYSSRHIRYKDILKGQGFIFPPDTHTGRKPDANVVEARMVEEEKTFYQGDWARWWMTIGGFQAPFVIDKCILAILDILD